MVHLKSNILSKVNFFYFAFGAEILRSKKWTSDATTFKITQKILIKLNNLFGRHFDVFPKHNNASSEFVESLLK